jgi:hypothetical protein
MEANATLWGFLGIVLGAIITGLFAYNVNRANASKAVTEAAINLVKPLSDRVDKLEKINVEQDKKIEQQERTIKKYGQRIVYLMNGIEKLIEQFQRSDIAPTWVPDKWDPNKDC